MNTQGKGKPPPIHAGTHPRVPIAEQGARNKAQRPNLSQTRPERQLASEKYCVAISMRSRVTWPNARQFASKYLQRRIMKRQLSELKECKTK